MQPALSFLASSGQPRILKETTDFSLILLLITISPWLFIRIAILCSFSPNLQGSHQVFLVFYRLIIAIQDEIKRIIIKACSIYFQLVATNYLSLCPITFFESYIIIWCSNDFIAILVNVFLFKKWVFLLLSCIFYLSFLSVA